MSRNYKIMIPIVVAITSLISAVVIMVLPADKAEDLNDITVRLETAQRYLVELDYSRAIAEFEAIINIDPMNADAYLGLAEAYQGKGETDKAIEILEKGYAVTGDTRFQAKFGMLKAFIQPEQLPVEPSETSAVFTVTETSTEETVTETTIETTIVSTSETISETTAARKRTSVTIDGTEYSTSITGGLVLTYSELTDDDIKELDEFTEIDMLDLGYNYISNISVLSDLTNLEYLALNDNEISDIHSLSKLKNLKKLYIGYNHISDISILNGTTIYAKIKLSHFGAK